MNTISEVVRFLEAHQPLPPDREWDQQTLDDLRRALDLLDEPWEPRIPQLLFDALGEGMYGHQNRACGIIARYPPAVIEPFLSRALLSGEYWPMRHAADVLVAVETRICVTELKRVLVPMEQLKSILPDLDKDQASEIREACSLAMEFMVAEADRDWLAERRAEAVAASDSELAQWCDERLDALTDGEGG